MTSIELKKCGHRFIVQYNPGDERSVLPALVAMATDCDTDFDWLDAAVMGDWIGISVDGELHKHLMGKK